MRRGETCKGEHPILLAGKDFCWHESSPGSVRWLASRGGLQVPGKHLFRVDSDECPGTAGQNFSLAVADLSRVGVAAALYALLPSGGYQWLAQRNRPQIPDLHGAGEGQNIPKLVHLAHGFVQDGGDNSTVRVPRGAGIPSRQFEVAHRFPRIFVQRELQAHALGIVMPAAEAVVLAWFGLSLDCVAV